MKRKTFYYKDEEKDDFSGIYRNTIKIDEKYKYIHNSVIWKLCAFVVYRIIILPFAYVYMKIKFSYKCVNKRILRKYKGKGYFMYGNHTLMAGDAFIPNLINMPRKTFTVVHPDNISLRVVKPIIEMCGALPLPDTINATKNFLYAIEKHVNNGSVIQIYPEAHVWPYYTGIRKFGDGCFKYPIKFDKPVFVMTNTFKRRLFFKTPKVVTYIDGPFFVDKSLSRKEQQELLRDVVYKTMCDRAKDSTYKYFKYVRSVSID